MMHLLIRIWFVLGLFGCSDADKMDDSGAPCPDGYYDDDGVCRLDESSTDSDGDGDGDDTGGTSGPCTDFDMDLRSAQSMLPSVVRISFKLTCDGEPVAGRTESDFTILEDGETISIFESDQQIVPTVASYQLSTLLLLDMSGSMIASGNLPALQVAAQTFIDQLAGGQTIGIYTFDGRETLNLLVPFTTDTAALTAGIDSLDDYEVVDSSTNLNGAIIYGLERLNSEADEHTDKLFGGTIAVFTDGKDQAGRVTGTAAVLAATNSDHAIYAIGLGGEIDEDHLTEVGKDGAFFASDVDALDDVFNTVADEILAEANSLYVLAYCSPKRAGDHELNLQLNETDTSINYAFNADSFEGGCDPTDFVPDEASTDADSDGDGWSTDDGDCDDADASVNPGAEEVCDEIDNNCNGVTDEGCATGVAYSHMLHALPSGAEVGSTGGEPGFTAGRSCWMQSGSGNYKLVIPTGISWAAIEAVSVDVYATAYTSPVVRLGASTEDIEADYLSLTIDGGADSMALAAAASGAADDTATSMEFDELWDDTFVGLTTSFYDEWMNLRFDYNRSSGEFHFAVNGEVKTSIIIDTDVLDASAIYLGSSGYAGGSPSACWSSLYVYQ